MKLSIGLPGGEVFALQTLTSSSAVTRIGNRPILFVALQDDRRMPPSIARDLYSHAASPHKALIVLPGHRHGEGFNQAREQYEIAVKQFLSEPGHAPTLTALTDY